MDTINDFGKKQIKEETGRRRYQTAKSYKTLFMHLKKFRKDRDLSFAEITAGFLMDFQEYLSTQGCCRNTSSLYMRHLQALHNRAAAMGMTPPPKELYRKSVFIGYEPAAKRGTTERVLALIRSTPLEGRAQKLAFARDMFILSFYLRGIPFIDLALLHKADLRNGIIRYRRRKTGRLVTVAIEPCAARIISRYEGHTEESPFLLPILKSRQAADLYKQYDSALRLYNKHLEELSNLLALDIRLTSYTPRHTWANIAHRQGIDIPYISEALGHSSEKTTRHYIQSFTADALAGINRKVIACIGNKQREGKKEKEKAHQGHIKQKIRSGGNIVPVLRKNRNNSSCKVIT